MIMNSSKTRNSESVNNYIEEYLDYYCSLTAPPGYAILLKGKWGSGKTWFINKFIENSQGNNKFLYVSLYGISDLSDIEYAFFQQLHPFMSSKEMALVGRCVKGMLKLALKIDLDNDGKADGSVSLQIPDLKLSEELVNIDKCILVFDDIERCSLDIKQILGYINYFVEQKDLKVILVADEEKILDKDEYFVRKEKLVGKTFSITLNFDDAFTVFVDCIEAGNASKCLTDNIRILKKIFEESRYDNLRLLKRIILDFDKIYKELPGSIKNNQQAIQAIIKYLSFYSIEYQYVQALSANLQELTKLIDSRHFGLTKESKNNEEEASSSNSLEKIVSKYSIFKFNDLFPDIDWWCIYFQKGCVNVEKLEESKISSKYFLSEYTPDWVKLWHFSDLSDDEFPKLLKKVSEKFWRYEYTDIGEICHIYGLLLYFSRANLCTFEVSEILGKSKQCIEYMAQNNLIDFTKFRDIHYDIGSYKSLVILEKDSTEYREFKEYVYQAYSLFQDNKIKDAAQNIVDTMKDDIWRFISVICPDMRYLKNESDESFYEAPILKYIDPRLFIDTLLQMTIQDQLLFFQSIKPRYELNQTKLLDELEWLEKIQELLTNEVHERDGKISGHILKDNIQNYLIPNISRLKKNI